ncbi:hypothetical protein [Mycobacterium sp. URHD0025]|uniref:hypothetical protein n=1 Tax=Mycobacterium sp. URHD0025 TaxID=1298864 RepID=UPI00055ADA7D|nr:hypothetical protein [Mycobacterium sp. URHD0025]
MGWRIRSVVTLAAAGGLALGGIGASPAAAASQFSPFSNQIRNCDHVKALFLDGMGSGAGSGWADVSTGGSNLSAQVHLQSAWPDSDYHVRLIQLPRSSAAPCNVGDPGVSGGVLHTDVSGTATITVSGPTMENANAAWVIVEGPPPPGRIRGDVYTSDFLAKF